MDAFRDSGLHWRYFQHLVDDPQTRARLEPDPFAAELLTENVAQFGVLLLRVTGRIGQEQGSETLQPKYIEAALRWIQTRIDANAVATERPRANAPLASSPPRRHRIRPRACTSSMRRDEAESTTSIARPTGCRA